MKEGRRNGRTDGEMKEGRRNGRNGRTDEKEEKNERRAEYTQGLDLT